MVPRRLAILAGCLCLLVGLAAPAGADRVSRATPVVRAVEKVGPCVVNIASKSVERATAFSTGDELMDRFFQDFMRPVRRERSSLGSGVIIDGARGIIATNSHVVSQASEITVQLADARVYPARLVGDDPASDLALLRIDTGQRLPQAELGQPGDLMIGETVIAIGNPFGLEHTVTTGVVSARGRRVPAPEGGWLVGLIQTDASINPGNSGGPLLNIDGQVIGINTAIFQKAQGIGFAIPIGRVRRVAADLDKYGEVRPVWLGLEVQELDHRLATHLGLPQAGGVVVTLVHPDSPAAAAGLAKGMVIQELDGEPVRDQADYAARLDQFWAGKNVAVRYYQAGQTRELAVTAQTYPLERSRQVAWVALGLQLGPLTREASRYHQVPRDQALMITQVRQGSPAAQAGLRSGDLVLTLDRHSLAQVRDFELSLARARFQDRVELLCGRANIRKTITFVLR